MRGRTRAARRRRRSCLLLNSDSLYIQWVLTLLSRHRVTSSGCVCAKCPLLCLTLHFEQLKPEHGGFERGMAEATCTPAYAHCSCTVAAVDAEQAWGGKQRLGAKIALICLTLRLEQLKPEHGGFDEGARARRGGGVAPASSRTVTPYIPNG